MIITLTVCLISGLGVIMQPLLVAADVWGHPVGPIFKGQRVLDPRRWNLQAVPKTLRRFFLENRTDRLSRNVGS